MAEGSALYGGWKVISTVVTTEGEGEREIPSTGYLLFTPEHRIAAIVGRPDRRPASSDAEELALARSIIETYRFSTSLTTAWSLMAGSVREIPTATS